MGSELPEDAEKETLESDTSLVVATLTEKEARQIEKKENVIIEEDVLLKASEEDDKEYSAEEKRKRRQEIKEKKKKSFIFDQVMKAATALTNAVSNLDDSMSKEGIGKQIENIEGALVSLKDWIK